MHFSLHRYVQRLTPVSATCTTNLPEIQSLCSRLLQPTLEEYGESSFKVCSSTVFYRLNMGYEQ